MTPWLVTLWWCVFHFSTISLYLSKQTHFIIPRGTNSKRIAKLFECVSQFCIWKSIYSYCDQTQHDATLCTVSISRSVSCWVQAHNFSLNWFGDIIYCKNTRKWTNHTKMIAYTRKLVCLGCSGTICLNITWHQYFGVMLCSFHTTFFPTAHIRDGNFLNPL